MKGRLDFQYGCNNWNDDVIKSAERATSEYLDPSLSDLLNMEILNDKDKNVRNRDAKNK